jgi:hypothetical protein
VIVVKQLVGFFFYARFSIVLHRMCLFFGFVSLHLYQFKALCRWAAAAAQ